MVLALSTALCRVLLALVLVSVRWQLCVRGRSVPGQVGGLRVTVFMNCEPRNLDPLPVDEKLPFATLKGHAGCQLALAKARAFAGWHANTPEHRPCK